MTLGRRILFLPLALGLLFLLIVVSVGFGSVAVPLDKTWAALLHGFGLQSGVPGDDKWDAIIFLVRLPRVLGAALIGAVLALAGAVMQGILRNPMADPGIIGISGGASFGAVLAIASGWGAQAWYHLPLAASLGALLAAGVIFSLTLRQSRSAITSLILAGMAVSTFLGAGTSLVLSFISRDNLAQFVFWSMGNLANIRWESLAGVVLPILLCLVVLPWFARDINIMLLGEEQARAVGLEQSRLRLLLLALVALMTALAVSISGPISFVGLIVPHMVRLVLGPDNRLVMPFSLVAGAIFLVACDLLARLALGGQELFVGVVTALVGAPYFLFLLLDSRRKEARQ